MSILNFFFFWVYQFSVRKSPPVLRAGVGGEGGWAHGGGGGGEGEGRGTERVYLNFLISKEERDFAKIWVCQYGVSKMKRFFEGCVNSMCQN